MSSARAMALSCLALEYIAWTKHRDYRSLNSIPSFSSSYCFYSLMGRWKPVRKPRSLTWALNNKPRVAESPFVESEQHRQKEINGRVDVPVNCYQVLGLPDGCSKDQVVKAAMELKGAEIDEGYSPSVLSSRQEVLMDVRDKILFEPEYEGNVREHVVPKSSLTLPWPWLPAALSLLQEVGEDRIVLEVGRITMQRANVKPYIHDILLSMALSECSIARRAFERGRVSEGFDALARAQLLLRSKRSLSKLTILAEIEESLEELAPSCLLEHLSMARTPENAERREGALTALRELLRQGLEAEASCAVTNWPVFLSQAMSKLLAAEIVSLLPWDTLATLRKNYHSSEARQQRIVIDFSCFHIALLAHIACGFSSKRPELIEKANTIVESLERTEAVNLSFEGAICKMLLGQGKAAPTEDLQKLGVNGSPLKHVWAESGSHKSDNGAVDLYASLWAMLLSCMVVLGLKVGTVSYARRRAEIDQEKWLKDAVLAVFVDTRDCSPSLTNYFGNKMKMPINNWNKKDVDGTPPGSPGLGRRFPSYSGSSKSQTLSSSVQALTCPSPNVIPEVGCQLSPSNTQGQSIFNKSKNVSSLIWRQNVGVSRKRVSGTWLGQGKTAEKMFLVALLTGCVFTALRMQAWIKQMPYPHTNLSTIKPSGLPADRSFGRSTSAAEKPRGNIGSRIALAIAKSLLPFRQQFVSQADQDAWPVNDLSLLVGKSKHHALNRQQMSFREAESLVRRWQSIKAEALGSNHEAHRLSEILSEPMLSQWQALAESAKSRSCFWRFVLLHLSVVHAEISSDGMGWEIAEVEAVLEEAAELVDESQLKNPNYYSTYHIRYVLKKGSDRKWKFCGGGIQSPV